MVFDELSRFEKIDDPEPREAQDIARKGKKHKKEYARASVGKTVSLKTQQRTSLFVTLAIWLTFLAGLAYVGYYALGLYIS